MGEGGPRRAGSVRRPLPGAACAAGRPVPTAHCASRSWALPSLLAGGSREEAVPPARGWGGGFVSKVWASRRGGRTRCPSVGGGGAGDSNATTGRPKRGAAVLPRPGRLLPQLEGARPRPRPQGRPLGGVRAPPYSPSRGRGWGVRRLRVARLVWVRLSISRPVGIPAVDCL